MKVCAIVDLSARESNEYAYLRSPPEGFEVESWRLAEGEPAGDDYPKNARIKMSPKEKGIELPDVVGNNEGLLIVSARLKRAIEGLRLPLEILPIAIYNHRGKVASNDHFILNPLGTFDCLDTDEAEIEYLDDEVVSVDKFAFCPKKLKKVPHLFRVKEDPSTIVLGDDVLKAWLTLVPEPTNFSIEHFEIPQG